ncbi:hypothetical protein KQI46_06250 [Lysinibacillus capsici]|uniref:hypothetical protein n=1 Tax=Lysinibacillus capsici TaxID=2115968 RepID=UPI001C113DC4|nr:hypothetical protein [Lysinibacillus capsici]MBU5251535.1 hypothetical protein [Lysinibacillus capsici]
MKPLLIFISAILIFISLFFILKAFVHAESSKEKMLILAFLFSEPLDIISITFYLGILGLATGLFIL